MTDEVMKPLHLHWQTERVTPSSSASIIAMLVSGNEDITKILEHVGDIRTEVDITLENIAEIVSEYQRCKTINALVEKYEKAIRTVSFECEKATNVPERLKYLVNCVEDVLQKNRSYQANKEVMDNESSLQRQSQDENKIIMRFIKELTLPIFQLKDMKIDDRILIYALEGEIKIVQNQRLPVLDDIGIQILQRCRSTSFRWGAIDAFIDRKTIIEATRETLTVDEYIEENNLKMSREDRKRLFKLVNKYSEELMEKHSNLNRISVSPVISHKNGSIEETPCIVIYCSCKGIRPHDEPDFLRQIEKVPVDVREGHCSLFGVTEANDYNDPLRTGISIGSYGMKDSGTLGPFVVEAENKTSVGFLTCQHVFQSADIGRNVVQPSVIHFKTDTNPDTTICGKIRSICMRDVIYNGKQTSVDVAYVALNKRIPEDFRFPDIPESLITKDFHRYPRMGQPIMHLVEDDIGIPVYKLGQASGLTEGYFDTVQTIAILGKREKEKVRNLYQVSSDKPFAKPGDSGSSVFTAKENTLYVIGLLLGGSDNCKECFVIPIGAALQALKPKLEILQLKDETTTDAEGSNDDHQCDGASASPSGSHVRIEWSELSKSVKPFSIKE